MAGLEIDEGLVAHAGEGEGEDDDEWDDEGEIVSKEPRDGIETALLDAINDRSVNLAGAGEF